MARSTRPPLGRDVYGRYRPRTVELELQRAAAELETALHPPPLKKSAPLRDLYGRFRRPGGEDDPPSAPPECHGDRWGGAVLDDMSEHAQLRQRAYAAVQEGRLDPKWLAAWNRPDGPRQVATALAAAAPGPASSLKDRMYAAVRAGRLDGKHLALLDSGHTAAELERYLNAVAPGWAHA